MANAQILKSYLEWQSEMGTEEVILPHPLIRKQSAASAAEGIPRSSTPTQKSGGQGSGESPPPGLFESLAKALEKAVNPTVPGASGKGSAGTGGRVVEAGALPVFHDPASLWEHLRANPHLLLGDAQDATAGHVASLVRGVGPMGASMALIGFEPSETDAAAGLAFQGDAGALLEKMMRAIRLETKELYLTNLIKVRSDKAWSRRELARLVPLLHVELALMQAPMILLLGQECAQAVLKTGKTLEELRQETHRLEGREFFATYHPQELLRKEELKRKAWEDLQWLQRRMAESQART
ncbi:MAG: uracil-DNA glycosylase [Fibrobacteria bacterium]